MANESQSWPMIVIMLAAISAIVIMATMVANFVQWMFA